MSVKSGAPSGVMNRAAKAARGTASKASYAVDSVDSWSMAAVDKSWDIATDKVPSRPGAGRLESGLRRAGQIGTMLTVVTLGLVIILGILVYSEVETALPQPSNSNLSNASDNATGDFADAMELAPVLLIVLIASLVLAVVQNFRS